MAATVVDVAQYILQRLGAISTIKLQKLVYYSQAWSLAWDDAPLFPEEIEAWANGPVVPVLYARHRGWYQVDPHEMGGNPDALTDEQKLTVDAVLEFYGDKSPQWLSDLTHNEDPWKDARAGIPDNERSNAQITKEALAAYYSSL
jgi:uncharacterized phage-associated protein